MSLRIELFVEDLDASIRFYEGALGFRRVRREAGLPEFRARRRGSGSWLYRKAAG
jgi:catechol 2,3-dioxygenase-like lactoylglutathione lyase family enzyme